MRYLYCLITTARTPTDCQLLNQQCPAQLIHPNDKVKYKRKETAPKCNFGSSLHLKLENEHVLLQLFLTHCGRNSVQHTLSHPLGLLPSSWSLLIPTGASSAPPTPRYILPGHLL